MKIFKRAVLGVAALALAAAPAVAMAPAASAQVLPEVVANGEEITPTLDFEGACTLGAIGTDNQGNLIGITAGHCDEQTDGDGGPVFLRQRPELGKVGDTVRTVRDPGFDYSIIKFDKTKVTPSAQGPQLKLLGLSNPQEPAFFQNQCRDGVTSGLKCGAVATKSNGVYGSFAVALPGDSGGPSAVRNSSAGSYLAGITVRIITPMPSEYISIHKILNDIPAGTPGAGFTLTPA